MVKDCPLHGHFEDVISIDPQLFRHLEEAFPGRDIRAHNDEKLHNHGSSTITVSYTHLPFERATRSLRILPFSPSAS